jgi:hypothetical protein
MVRLKTIIFLSLALAVAAVSLGFDQGFCETKPKSKAPVQQTQKKIKPVPQPPKDVQLSQRNQMMLEVNEQAKIRRQNILNAR